MLGVSLHRRRHGGDDASSTAKTVKPGKALAQIAHHVLFGHDPASDNVGFAFGKNLDPFSRGDERWRCVDHLEHSKH